jgi:hypothetical protein
MPHSGQCLCGAVRVVIDSEPSGARMCWCRDCQYIASGSATVNILFPPESVQFSGNIATYTMIADSGNTVERGFCKGCGSQLYSNTIEPAGPPMRVRAGLLDNRELISPQAIIWTESAPDWAILDPALPHHPKGPDSPLKMEPGRDG